MHNHPAKRQRRATSVGASTSAAAAPLPAPAAEQASTSSAPAPLPSVDSAAAAPLPPAPAAPPRRLVVPFWRCRHHRLGRFHPHLSEVPPGCLNDRPTPLVVVALTEQPASVY
eukprot:6211962-Pleurochrysis_carterae.AAC.2